MCAVDVATQSASQAGYLKEYSRTAPGWLQVMGADMTVKTFSLKELQDKFPKAKVTTTLQCAGNRRSEMSSVRKVNGLLWGTSISTAEWTGVRLRDVLLAMGVTPGPDAKHVQFVGLDCDMNGAH